VPTYVTTVGRFGAAIADRLAADPPSPSFAVCRVRGPHDLDEQQKTQLLPWYRQTVVAELTPLLRAAATSGDAAGGRLDLVIVADVAEVGGPILTALGQTLSEVLAGHFAVMFPPDTPAEQRGVGLIVVVATPAIDRSAGGAAAIDAIERLASWHRAGPPSPILDRVFVLPRQNEVMPLADDDVERAVALFVAAAFRAGLRESDVFRKRLGPPRAPDRLVDAFAVAAADVDVPRLLGAFGWRSALAGLTRLQAQADGKGSAGHVPELDVDGWLGPMKTEAPATTLTARAGNASPSELDALVRAVDVAEGDAVIAATRAIHEAVDGRIGPDDGLVALSPVRQGLDRAAEKARAAAAPGPSWLPSAETVASAEAEDAAEEAAAAALAAADAAPAVAPPSPVLTGALLGVVVGAAVASVAAVAGVRAATSGASSGGGTVVGAGAAPVGGDATTALIWGGLAAIVIAAAWIFGARVMARRKHDTDEEARKTAVTPRAARGRRLVAALEVGLAVRRRRLARAIDGALTDERARLDAARGALHAAQARCRARLAELGVTPAADPLADDHARLWDHETPLHLALLPTTALPRLWERSRAVREDDVWAARLLGHAWPRGGHRDDLPFADGGAWEQAARAQHGALVEAGVFAWPEVAGALAGQLQRLFATAPGALGLGVRPRRDDGTPETLSDARELVIIVPPEGRAAVDRALASQPLADARVMTGPAGMSRVLILRTAGEISVEALTRGART
jgi:hypothetical protein